MLQTWLSRARHFDQQMQHLEMGTRIKIDLVYTDIKVSLNMCRYTKERLSQYDIEKKMGLFNESSESF